MLEQHEKCQGHSLKPFATYRWPPTLSTHTLLLLGNGCNATVLNTRTSPCISRLRCPTVTVERGKKEGANKSKRSHRQREQDHSRVGLTLALWLGSELRPLGELYSSLETTHRNSV